MSGRGATDVVSIFDSGKLWFRVPETTRIEFHGSLNEKSMGKDVALQLLKDIKTDGAIYESFEFGGPGLQNLSVAARMTISNMCVEMGAKAGIFEGDNILKSWLEIHPPPNLSVIPQNINFIVPEENSNYKTTRAYNLHDIPPLVAKPHKPDNVVPVEEIGDVEIDEAFIGSCTNGRLEDLEVAAQILNGKEVKKDVKCIIVPASKQIYLQAMQKGLLEILIKAGCVVEYPSCGPCIGGHLGVLGPDEVAVSSSNRNFEGRMGDATSRVYLASPAVVAASMLTGKISIPEKAIWREN